MPRHAIIDPDAINGMDAVVVMEQAIEVPADVVFASLAAPDDWPEWLGIDVRPGVEPEGVGYRRTVWLRPTPHVSALGQHELFTAWEDGQRLAFSMERSPMPVRAFAEDWLLTELPGGGARLRWTIGVDGIGPVVGIVAAGMQRMGDRALPTLARLLESRA